MFIIHFGGSIGGSNIRKKFIGSIFSKVATPGNPSVFGLFNNMEGSFLILVILRLFHFNWLGNSVLNIYFVGLFLLLAPVVAVVSNFFMSKDENPYPYKLARLVDCKGDISKKWYIIYYVWNKDLHRLVRKREFSINHFDSVTERRAYAKRTIKEINSLLVKGATTYNVAKEDSKEIDLKNLTVIEAVQYAIKIKSSTLRKNSIDNLTSLLTALTIWAKDNKYEKVPFRAANVDFIYKFFDYLLVEKKIGAKRYNNLKGYFSTIFNFFIERGLIEKNPVAKIKKLNTESGKHAPYTKQQLKEIKETALMNGEEQLVLFIQFIYYTFIRPGELIKLQVRHITEKTIYVPGDISKNRKSEHVVIPAHLQNQIEKYKLRSYPPHYYIFSRKGKPGEVGVGESYFPRKNRKILDALNFNYDKFDLYSYKHTGVINLFNAGADIKSIQKQCRHSSIEQTDIYMKNLGLIRNEDLNYFPEF